MSILSETEIRTAYISIGKAAELLGCSKSVLRFYENEFELYVPRTSSKRRLYTENELKSFRYIFMLKENNYSNAQIKKVLKARKNEDDKYLKDEEYLEKEAPPDISQLNATDELRKMIEELRNEIIDLKRLSDAKVSDELLLENKELKEKLKEKTYELVDVREKLSKLKARKKFM